MQEDRRRKIDEEFLLGLDVDEADVNKVLTVLQGNEVRKVAALLAFSSEERLRNLKEKNKEGADVALGEGTIALLWKYIEDTRGGTAATFSASKRLRRIPEHEKDSASGFVNSSYLLRTDIDFCKPDSVDFSLQLWGEERNQSFLLKRKSTADIASNIVDKFLSSTPRPAIILAGSKGTGKSCEGIFMIRALIDKGRVILFEQGKEKMLIVEQRALETFREALDEVFARYMEHPLSHAGVYAFEPGSEDFFLSLSKNHSFVHIVDIGDNYEGVVDVAHPQIIISSPNSEKLKRSGEVGQPHMRYLSPWTREELEALNDRLSVSAHGGNQYHLVRKSPKDLKELIKMFGGIPREIFKDRTVDQAASHIRLTVGSVGIDVWKSVFTQCDYTQLPKTVPGVLMHITKEEKWDNLCQVSFASKYVAKIVVRKFYQSRRNELFALASSVRGERRLTTQLRGEMLQQRMHEVFQAQPCELWITRLLENAGRGQRHKLIVPVLKLKEFASNKMLDLESVAENDFCVALSSIFPSVESFFIVKKRLLGVDEDGLCIVGLQSTTARTHPLKRKGLKDIIKLCHDLLGLTLPIYVIFVTTPNGIHARQVSGKRHERFDDQVLQFLCTDVNFNEILNLYPDFSEEDPDFSEEDPDFSEEDPDFSEDDS